MELPMYVDGGHGNEAKRWRECWSGGVLERSAGGRGDRGLVVKRSGDGVVEYPPVGTGLAPSEPQPPSRTRNQKYR